MMQSKLGFGVVGDLPITLVRDIATMLEERGFHSLWFNETPDGDALARIAAASQVTNKLVFGTGVINLDAKTPTDIIGAVQASGVSSSRLILGVGASAKPSPLATVQTAVEALKAALDVPVVVGSLGPRMRKLGAERADGLLFNWLPPKQARETTRTMREQASIVGNNNAIAATYIRTALGGPAKQRLETEAAKYSSFPSYAANFKRLQITAMEGAVHGDRAEDIVAGLQAFDGAVDQVIVRAITADDHIDQYRVLIDAVAPLAR